MSGSGPLVGLGCLVLSGLFLFLLLGFGLPCLLYAVLLLRIFKCDVPGQMTNKVTTMAGVKFKPSRSKDNSTKRKLIKILSSNDIFTTRLIPPPEGIVIVTQNS